MATFLVAHGAWTAGWAWKKMRPLLEGRGHVLLTPTYTGLGERSHLAHPDIDLETHIADVLGVLRFEDLERVTLIGHSYGGMVATGVADRAPERISCIVYVDAFVPRDDQSLFDLQISESRERMRAEARAQGEGWRIPPPPMSPDTSQDDFSWVNSRRVMQPIKTFEQRLRLTGAVESLPRAYVYCKRARAGDVFRQFLDRARRDPGWRAFEIDASHSPNITAPEALTEILEQATQ
jgi:pimeloyl-ACP methyl ester carboxylesterase